MKMTKKGSATIVFLLLLLGSIGVSQEVQAAPPIIFDRNLEIDFDMKFSNGTPYTEGQILVDIEEEYSNQALMTFGNNFLNINRSDARDILITSTTGNYKHTYGLYDIGSLFEYNAPSFRYVYYTNFRILPKGYIKSISLGDVKTFRSTGFMYDPYWNINQVIDSDIGMSDSNDKFNVLPDRTHVLKEANYLTSAHIRPTVEFASIQIGDGASRGTYHNTSRSKSGKKVNFVVTPYQVKENYVDKYGTAITPPSGFTQGKLTDAKADQFTHTLTGLPVSYTTGGKYYVLKGSYKGQTMPGTLNTSNPPSITVDYTDSSITDFDQESQITAVYALGVKLTEKYVDESGVQIDAAWNPSTPLDVEDGEPFTIPHSVGDTKIDSGGKAWEYIGWKYDTDPAGTKRTSTTTGTISGDTTIEYIYKLAKTTASLNLNPTPQIVDNNDTVSWSSRLENTGSAPLKDLVLKSTSNWSSGLTDPVQVTVTPAGGSSQNFTVNPGDWASGVNLSGITIPNGGVNNYADITFTTTATGAVNQVLPAEIELDGNIPTPITAENFVRIDDPDEPNLKPVGNAGLINIPDFRFGQTEVKPYAQTKGLDTSSYQTGYSPYIRLLDKESTGGWTLTGKLGQFISGAQTLPTTTSITLKNGMLNEVQNYDKSNESLSAIGSAGTVTIPSDSSTIAFTNGSVQGVYQLDYAFNDVELNLMGHSGVAGLSYTATMDWTLTTAP